MTYLIGDGQSEWDSGSISFEGQPIAGSVFNGADGDYWGTLRFDVTGLINEPRLVVAELVVARGGRREQHDVARLRRRARSRHGMLEVAAAVQRDAVALEVGGERSASSPMR